MARTATRFIRGFAVCAVIGLGLTVWKNQRVANEDIYKTARQPEAVQIAAWNLFCINPESRTATFVEQGEFRGANGDRLYFRSFIVRAGETYNGVRVSLPEHQKPTIDGNSILFKVDLSHGGTTYTAIGSPCPGASSNSSSVFGREI